MTAVNLIILIRMGNITDRLVSSCARSIVTFDMAYMKCVYGWEGVLYVIITGGHFVCACVNMGC